MVLRKHICICKYEYTNTLDTGADLDTFHKQTLCTEHHTIQTPYTTCIWVQLYLLSSFIYEYKLLQTMFNMESKFGFEQISVIIAFLLIIMVTTFVQTTNLYVCTLYEYISIHVHVRNYC